VRLFGLRARQVECGPHLHVHVLQRDEGRVRRGDRRPRRVRVQGLLRRTRLRGEAGELLEHSRLAHHLLQQRAENRALAEQFLQRRDRRTVERKEQITPLVQQDEVGKASLLIAAAGLDVGGGLDALRVYKLTQLLHQRRRERAVDSNHA